MVLSGCLCRSFANQHSAWHCKARALSLVLASRRVNLGIFRNFRIWERLNFQFRAEAFNAANHTNVQSIGTSATSGTFGEITGYRDARILQFAGKFTF